MLVSAWILSEKSDLAQACRYAANAASLEFSSECRTTWLMKVAVSLLPVVKSMIAARLPALPAAPENSCQACSSMGTALAGTGLRPTSFSTRSGACSSTCRATLAPIECPITENRSQPSSPARTIASAAASSMVNSPATCLRPP